MRSAGASMNRRAGNKKGRSDREAQVRRWLCGVSWKHSPGSSQLSTTLTHYFHTSCFCNLPGSQSAVPVSGITLWFLKVFWNLKHWQLGKKPIKTKPPKKPKTKPERWQGLSINEMAPNLTHENGSHQSLPRKEKKNENKCCHIKPMIVLTVETILVL